VNRGQILGTEGYSYGIDETHHASGKVRELTADGEQGTAKFKTLSVMNENHGGCVAGLKLNTGGGSWDEKKEMLNEVQS